MITEEEIPNKEQDLAMLSDEAKDLLD